MLLNFQFISVKYQVARISRNGELIMIREDEAFWAGIAVATLMLGGGFSMLFLRTLTGEGAVVLALGLMTMALTMQLRAKPRRYVESWTPVEARSLPLTEPIEAPMDPEPTQPEPKAEQQPSQPQEEATQPTEQPQAEPAESPQPPQPVQPEPPVEQKPEPPAPEAPKEEPIVVF
jgi:hypothetical protein